MPTPLLDAYASQVTPLHAEESLSAAERIAVGTGSLRKGMGRRIADGWSRQVDRERPKLRPQSKAEYLAHAAAAGVAVRMTPKRRADG